jgi:hypothetical protein
MDKIIDKYLEENIEQKEVPFKESMWINVKSKNKSEMVRSLIDKALKGFGWVIDKNSIHFNPGFETDRGFDGSRNFQVQAFFTVKEIK